MDLKGRLGAIAEKIPQCGTLADVGTDHAYIPIFAVKNSMCRKAIAADVKSGPVGIAARNIKRYGYEKRIETRLGYGLEPITEAESDVIVIAGMGGILIREIIEKSIEKAQIARVLILQPMNMAEVLRKWLNENGFEIFDETLAEESDKIYNILS
ncbi:MAG: SAM-dependent methyltransferase, partial [Ruminiclostridium sp.]|nr:SAM-dependent methyltransferase [Ruminiclostridium sp.]